MVLDVISFVIGWPALEAPGIAVLDSLFRDENGRQRQTSTKETDRKKAQRLGDEYQKASRTKRSLRQPQAVLDRLREELSGERVVRTSLRQYLDDWFDAWKAETAPSTMTFYRTSLAKFWQFVGRLSRYLDLSATDPFTS